MHVQTLSAGARLAERYQIEDLVGETHRAQMWRANDDVLNRSVSVQVIGSDSPAADAFLTAARRATAVDDPRFLRVLDAAYENGYAYVVREWASGVSLDNVLRAGPLSAVRSISLVREVAEAVANAHRAGVQHGCLDPARILITHSGAVRLLGLATDQALSAPTEDVSAAGESGRQADVSAVGALLYACLVARWPGVRDVGLPVAPTEHGRLLRPRQVRAGVDPATDAMCDRILDISQRHNGDSPRTADEVARELAALIPADETTGSFAAPHGEDDQTISYGVLPTAPAVDGPPPAVHKVPPPRTTQQTPVATVPPPPARRRTGARLLVWLAVALLVALAGVFTFLLVPRTDVDPPDESGSASASTTAPAETSRPLDIAGVEDFDPLGEDGENPETVAFTYDGDPSTAWTTSGYFSELQLQKEGVGLLVDLGKPREVTGADLQLVGRPTAVELYAAPGASSPPTAIDGLDLIGQDGKAGTEVSLDAQQAVRTQYLVVWLTSLPQVETGTWRGSVAEVVVRG